MRRRICVILTVCCAALLFSCVDSVGEGVLIIPSSGNSAVVTEASRTAGAEPSDTEAVLQETEAPLSDTEAPITELAAPDAEDAFDALSQAQHLLEDETFLALLAQYEDQTPADVQTATVAAVLAYQHMQGTFQVPDGSDDTDGPVVYWTAGGSVWHVTDACSALAKSKSILSGSETQAQQAGKTRVCKRCGT